KVRAYEQQENRLHRIEILFTPQKPCGPEHYKCDAQRRCERPLEKTIAGKLRVVNHANVALDRPWKPTRRARDSSSGSRARGRAWKNRITGQEVRPDLPIRSEQPNNDDYYRECRCSFRLSPCRKQQQRSQRNRPEKSSMFHVEGARSEERGDQDPA